MRCGGCTPPCAELLHGPCCRGAHVRAARRALCSVRGAERLQVRGQQVSSLPQDTPAAAAPCPALRQRRMCAQRVMPPLLLPGGTSTVLDLSSVLD